MPFSRVVGLGLLLAVGAAASAGDVGFQEAFALARPKVVVLRVHRAQSQSLGTGFLAAQGVVLTARHVVRNARQVEARVNGNTYPVELAYEESAQDLAALVFRKDDLLMKPLALADSRELAPGDPLLIVTTQAARPGANAETEQRLAIPAILYRRALKRGPTAAPGPQLVLQTRVERGDSGAPVLRISDGAVVGLLISRELPDEEDVSRLAYAIPAEVAAPQVARAAGQIPIAAGALGEFYLIPLARP
ncbi:MAG: trypsin-like peptidase domain-containing protein [Armatimonadetes bacterium]|nr:trypsin-like peptidase domain-containing protein [Armatimonadota bacterium]